MRSKDEMHDQGSFKEVLSRVAIMGCQPHIVQVHLRGS